MLAHHEPPTRPDTVKAKLTPKRPRRQVENDEYAAFVRRILRAYSRRVGNGDVEALVLMLGLGEEIDTAIAEAVTGLRVCGYSRAEIGARLSITRQAAQQRWGAGSTLTATLVSPRDWRQLARVMRRFAWPHPHQPVN